MISNGIEFNGAAIAKSLGITRATFYESVRNGRVHMAGTGRHKLPPRPKATPELVALLKHGGKTFREIAIVLRTSEVQVLRAYAKHGRPSPGENKSR